MKSNRHINDLTGRHFGRLTAEKLVGNTDYKVGKWLCKCECGNTAVVLASNLTGGHTRSCGCLRVENRRRIERLNKVKYKK